MLVQRSVVFIATALALTCSAVSQNMPVPVEIQIPLFLKMLTFDRSTQARGSQPLNFGILFQASNRNATRVRDEAQRMLAKTPRIGNAELRVFLINLDDEDLAKTLEKNAIEVLYVCPLRGVGIEHITSVTQAADVLTVTGLPVYAERGIAVSFGSVNEKPQIIINLTSAKREGADFDSRVLALSKVIY